MVRITGQYVVYACAKHEQYVCIEAVAWVALATVLSFSILNEQEMYEELSKCTVCAPVLCVITADDEYIPHLDNNYTKAAQSKVVNLFKMFF